MAVPQNNKKSLLEERVRVSKCYGKKYDYAEHACKCCEVWLSCEEKTARYKNSMPRTKPKWAKVKE